MSSSVLRRGLRLCAATVAVVGAALTGPLGAAPALADIKWDFTGGNDPTTGPATTPHSLTVNGITATVTGWANTGTGNTLKRSYVGDYDKGLGVTNSSDTSHTVDNLGHVDFVMFQFSVPVRITSLAVAAFGDTDLEVWTGSLALGASLEGKTLAYLSTVLVDHGVYPGDSVSRTVNFSNFAAGNTLIVAAAPGQTDDSFKISSVTAVPGPIAGAGLPVVLSLAGGALLLRRRRSAAAA